MSRERTKTVSALGYPNREAVRIKVKKYEDDQEPEYRKFSVDPQITTYSILRCLLSRAFELKGEFAISYMAIDDFGEETFLALLSDWDLDAAFLSASEPYLHLRLEVRPFDVSGQWDPEPGLDLTQLRKPSADLADPRAAQAPPPGRLLGNVLNQVQNTFSLMSRALNMGDDRPAAPLAAPPLTDAEFHNYLDTVGRLVQPKELRVAIYRGGVVPSLRKVVWKHLLNVYPENMTARERIDYVKSKSAEYRDLRDCWMKLVQDGKITDEIHQSTNMVKKDVLRTDRHLPFFAGGDDNINVVSLFNILTTYALNHPSVGYCQGMSDLVSPLLYVLQNEAQAYISFCGLMCRLKPNFDLDGAAMTDKFQHLTEALQFYDPEFFDYLKDRQADDLLFCYRWLLLELKREFAFEEALRMLEVLWSSLPPDWPAEGLQLFEQRYTGAPPPEPVPAAPAAPAATPPPAVTKRPTLGSLRRRTTTAYSKVCAIRRQSSGTVSLGNSPLLKKEFSSSEGAATGMAASKRVQSLDGIAGGGSARRATVAAGGRTFSDEERQARKEKLLRERRLQSSESEAGSPPAAGAGSSGRRIRDLGEFRRLTRQSATGSSGDSSGGGSGGGGTSGGTSGTSGTSGTGGGLTLDLQPVGDGESPASPVTPVTPATPSDESDYCSIECPAAAEMRRQRERLERSTSCFIQHAAADDDAVDIFENPILEEEAEVGSAPAAGPVSPAAAAEPAAEPAATAVSYSSGPAPRSALPPPQEFGGGNPFLIFLCLSLLQQHRDVILSRRLDYQEVAMLFDKMVRKHDVARTLEQARKMFTDYLKRGWSVATGLEDTNGADVGV